MVLHLLYYAYLLHGFFQSQNRLPKCEQLSQNLLSAKEHSVYAQQLSINLVKCRDRRFSTSALFSGGAAIGHQNAYRDRDIEGFCADN